MTIRRTIDPAKRRTVDRSTQSPVLIPAEFHHPQPDPTPQPRLTGTLAERLRARRTAERAAKAKEDAA